MCGASLFIPGFRECLRPLSNIRRDGFPSCRRCAILEKCAKVEKLWKEVNSLHIIEKNEQEIDKDPL